MLFCMLNSKEIPDIESKPHCLIGGCKNSFLCKGWPIFKISCVLFSGGSVQTGVFVFCFFLIAGGLLSGLFKMDHLKQSATIA